MPCAALTQATISNNISLTHANTLGLQCTASHVLSIDHLQALANLPKTLPIFVLSGGSNVLLPPVLDALVIRPKITGIKVVSENATSVVIEVGCGVVWHDLVSFCMQKGWYGLENLALIPGLVGAAPIQNIGAYGVEIKDRLLSLTTFDLHARTQHTFANADCGFAYRYSIFKDTHKHHLITSVRFSLHKNPADFNSDYGDVNILAQQLAMQNGQNIDPWHVFNAIIQIRQSKLPDPAILPNCGSFFQNPLLTADEFAQLQQHLAQFPPVRPLPHYVQGKQIKVPAGWLIEMAGLKGGGVFPILTHEKQALVLTNHAKGQATAQNVLAAERLIQNRVFAKFSLMLVREPVWVHDDGSF